MQETIIFTPSGFTVDRSDESTTTVTIKQLYDSSYNNESSDDSAHNYLLHFARKFIDIITHDPIINFTRKAPDVDQDTINYLLDELPFCLGVEHVTSSWIKNLWDKFVELFDNELSEFPGTVLDYIRSKNNTINVAGRVFFHLVEANEDNYPFAFLATYTQEPADGSVTSKPQHLPLSQAMKEFKKDTKGLLDLLSTVSKATEKSDFLSQLVQSGELFHPLKFNSDEAYEFLCQIPLFEDCGIICRIPNFWRKKGRSRISITVGPTNIGGLGVDTLLVFSPTIYLGDLPLTQKEIEELLSDTSKLAFIKGKWVEVDRSKLTKLIKQLDQIKNSEFSFAEGLQLMAGIKQFAKSDDEDNFIVEISNSEWLQNIMGKLKEPSKIETIPTSPDFTGILRHYQQIGLNWLHFNKDMGFGALLADDMGLGKTVQILALLDKMRSYKIKTLLIVPTSLLVNWQKESAKFAPLLEVQILHGNYRNVILDDADLFITSYGMTSRIESLKSYKWDLLIIDEAQAIKNVDTKVTKSIKQLKAKARIALTGTPIENKLGDLWSIFDFLNKGMLGNAKEFTQFSNKLKNHPEGYAKLRGVVSPFILRRLKTDKSIISDLPDKLEFTEYTTLTKKQVVLYQALVTELKDVLDFKTNFEMSEFQRKGKILSVLMKFKQICNHPDHYSGLGSFDPSLSGKFETLAEICETIREKHESVLVFTQFREMCDPLNNYLESIFGRSGLVIHGGVSPENRGKIVDKFNSQYVPFMVLSIKAGGVGLNLTSANHVVHFDRWWNPAIENQATDRAFRIGQTKDVMVHKFVTTGTVEEKINNLLIQKQKLADDIISPSSGENWVTNMSNEEILDLFELEV
ncbi:MAG: DEAD/DEAH box helicase [Christensenellaceae bacterium]|nr:DEAD/DEAH box helicase [Christensenellaceae bacterium]